MNKSNWRGKRQTGQKPRSAEKEGAGGRGGGTTRISPDSQAGRGNRNCDQNENMAGIGWVENVRGRGRRDEEQEEDEDGDREDANGPPPGLDLVPPPRYSTLSDSRDQSYKTFLPQIEALSIITNVCTDF